MYQINMITMMMAMITRTLLQNVALCAINENDVDDDDD